MSLVVSDPAAQTHLDGGYDFVAADEHQLVDAMPYFDQDVLTTDMRISLEAMLQAEQLQKDQLHPSMQPAFEIKLLSLVSELDRVQKDEMLSVIDLAKYRPQRPDQGSTSLAAYQSSLEAFRTATVYQQDRATNLHLLQNYGANVWRAHNYQVQELSKRLDNEEQQLKLQIEAVNRSRKESQQDMGPRLEALEQRWQAAVQGKVKLQLAILREEQTLVELESELQQKESEIEA